MIRELKLLYRALVDVELDKISFVIGLDIGMVLTLFLVPVALAISGYGTVATELFATSLLVIPVAAIISGFIGLGVAYYELGRENWEQLWTDLEAEYGGN